MVWRGIVYAILLGVVRKKIICEVICEKRNKGNMSQRSYERREV
jgi:hypothetical protein